MAKKKPTNKYPAMLRLPLEILVHIIELVQRSPESVTWPDAWSCAPPTTLFPMGALGDDIYDLRWYNVMLVCSHLRVIAVRSPALWSFIDTRWPRTFINVCVSRALPRPLQVLAHVSDSTSSLLATRLLHHARDAEIIFNDPAAVEDPSIAYFYHVLDDIPAVDISPSMWRALCQRVLKTASKLRSLTVNVVVRSDWVAGHVLRLVKPVLGGERSTITRLDLAEVHLSDLPDMPYLTHLRLSQVVPPPDDPAWLKRWLSAAPNIRVLGLVAQSSALDVSTAPIYLPHLLDLIVLVPRDMALPILATIPPPHRSLMFDADSREAVPAEVEKATVARLHAYLRQFKAQVGGHVILPPPTLDIQHGPDQSRYILEVERMPGSPRLQVHVGYGCVQATGPFLTEVVRCTLRVQTLRDIDWAELLPLAALGCLRICTTVRVEPAEADSVQEWVDTRGRAGCAVGLVEITHEPQIYQEQHVRVVWKPAECTLAEAAWAT